MPMPSKPTSYIPPNHLPTLLSPPPFHSHHLSRWSLYLILLLSLNAALSLSLPKREGSCTNWMSYQLQSSSLSLSPPSFDSRIFSLSWLVSNVCSSSSDVLSSRPQGMKGGRERGRGGEESPLSVRPSIPFISRDFLQPSFWSVSSLSLLLFIHLLLCSTRSIRSLSSSLSLGSIIINYAVPITIQRYF